MRLTASLHAVVGMVALLVALAGGALAQTADFDEHGRPSLFPLQAGWWAAQTGADIQLAGNTPRNGRDAASKPVEPAKQRARDGQTCAADAGRPAKKGAKTGSTPCPSAK